MASAKARRVSGLHRKDRRVRTSANATSSTGPSRSLEEAKSELFEQCERANRMPSQSSRALEIISELQSQHNDISPSDSEAARRVMLDGTLRARNPPRHYHAIPYLPTHFQHQIHHQPRDMMLSLLAAGHYVQLYSDTAATVDEQFYPLSLLSFGTIAPGDARACIQRVEQYVGPNGYDDRHSGYDIVQYIFLESSGSEQAIEGKLTVGADYEFDTSPDEQHDTIRQTVTFKFIGAEPEGITSLDDWSNAGFSNNASYDPDTGAVCEYIDAKPQGFIDCLYVDRDHRITRGNRGSIVIARRL